MFSRNRAQLARSRRADTTDRSGDLALVARLRARDPEALGQAYAEHGAFVHAVAMRILGDHQLAEECTQDTFMTLWRSAETIDVDRARLTTWLYVVARNRAIALERRRSARPATPVADVPTTDVAPDPAELVARDDEARRVVDALAELPDLQRQVITLAYFGGLSQAEIAERLDLPLGTVKGRARLALDRLRTRLSDGLTAQDGTA